MHLFVVSTCTNQKASPVAPACRIAMYSNVRPDAAAEKWAAALNSSEPRLVASRMYKGLHWMQSLACRDEATRAGMQARMWVLSAGYGLITAETPICSYAATFAKSADSVQNLRWPPELGPAERCRRWWDLLRSTHPRGGGNSLTSLTRRGSRSDRFILIIASQEYYPAIEGEVIQLASAGENLLIVSAGLFRERTRISPLVRDHLLPLGEKAKFGHRDLNKPNVALNATTALWLLRSMPRKFLDGWEAVRSEFERFHDSLPEYNRPDPVRMTDEEVLAFISCHFRGKSSSATQLLRKLRHEERLSCEQKRFGALFALFVASLESKQGRMFDGK